MSMKLKATTKMKGKSRKKNKASRSVVKILRSFTIMNQMVFNFAMDYLPPGTGLKKSRLKTRAKTATAAISPTAPTRPPATFPG